MALPVQLTIELQTKTPVVKDHFLLSAPNGLLVFVVSFSYPSWIPQPERVFAMVRWRWLHSNLESPSFLLCIPHLHLLWLSRQLLYRQENLEGSSYQCCVGKLPYRWWTAMGPKRVPCVAGVVCNCQICRKKILFGSSARFWSLSVSDSDQFFLHLAVAPLFNETKSMTKKTEDCAAARILSISAGLPQSPRHARTIVKRQGDATQW